jgi:hypothetical protein
MASLHQVIGKREHCGWDCEAKRLCGFFEDFDPADVSSGYWGG